MSSSDKTPFLQLNQWTGSDKPKRLDFNADNQAVDTAVALCAEHAQNREVHVTEAEKAALGSLGCTTGTYVGDGKVSRTVALPFAPAFGILFASGKTVSYHNFGYASYHNYTGFFSSKGCSEGVNLGANGQLTVFESQSVRIDGTALNYNTAGITYVYILWK